MEKKVLQVRLPVELHAKLLELKGSRSLNAEIVARLEQAVEDAVHASEFARVNAGWSQVVPAEEVAPVVSPGKAKGKGLPVPSLAPFTAAIVETDASPGRVFESERPRAGRRTMICAHRRRPDEFCPRCD